MYNEWFWDIGLILYFISLFPRDSCYICNEDFFIFELIRDDYSALDEYNYYCSTCYKTFTVS